jgi:hypothetical protein
MDDETIGIEEEFRKSWDNAEQYYTDEKRIRVFPPCRYFPGFISEIRFYQYEEWFSVSTLPQYLTLRRGAEDKPSYVQFSIIDKWIQNGVKLDIRAWIHGKFYQLKNQPVKFTNEVKILLDMLMTVPIE